MIEMTPETLRNFPTRVRWGQTVAVMTKAQVDAAASAWEADRSRIEELERERAQVEQFIRDMYTGRFAKRESNYWMLPQWIRDAIEADPLYKEET